MSTIRHEIDHELNQMKLPSDFASTIMQTKKNASKPFYKRLSAAAVLLIAVLMLGTSSIALYITHQTIFVAKKAIPELDDMIVYPYAYEGNCFQKEYDSYDALKKEMPFPLLDSAYAHDNEMIRVTYDRNPDRPGTQSIRLSGFIIGDVEDLEITPDRKSYSCSQGKDFYRPVDLYIEIISDKETADNALTSWQYEEGFKFIDQYTSKQGYKVNIIGWDYDNHDYHAIFVADGIRYELQGGVTLEKMKEIVDSMRY